VKRRSFIRAVGASAVLAAGGAVAAAGSVKARVVVIGGGYGGATAAKYLRMWSGGTLEVTLIEPNAAFISCPMSNLVLGGSKTMADITLSYAALVQRHGVKLVHDSAQAIDPVKRTVQVAGGDIYAYDRLVLSPGIDFIWDEVPGMLQPGAQEKVLHAWKAGAQTLALRRQLEAMPDGGVFAVSIPLAPFRCPPAPYERACQVAHYFSQAKKKSRVLILDANAEVASKPALFRAAWARWYPDMIEYRPGFQTADVDAATNTAISDFGDRVEAAVLNLVPPQRAGAIAMASGLANINKRWCEVDFLTYESTQAKNIHILGDAIQVAAQMPKSAHMANQQAKVCAAAIIDLLNARAPNSHPLVANTCYSFMTELDAAHVASVHTYDVEHKTMLPLPGAGGLSVTANPLEARYGHEWARNIWADTLG
jgi:sulfide dehydrogenase [flavocytochrome c] flavoprotein subunit